MTILYMKGGYNFLLNSTAKKSKSKRIRSRRRGGKKNKTRKGGNLGIRHYYKYNDNGSRIGGKQRKIKGGGMLGNITGSFDTDMVGGSGSLNNFGSLRQIGNFNNSLYPV